MNVFGNSSKQLLQALTANAEKETMDYVLQEMQAVLGEEMPEADAVRTYLQDPDKPTELSTTQRIVARTYEPLLLYIEVGLIYLIFCTVLTRLQSYGEKRLRTYVSR